MATLIDPLGTREVFLNPGDFHFHCPLPGRSQPTRLRTLLGSCVSVILWHPERRLAGMSHVILPDRGRSVAAASLDGRYCDESITLFHRELVRTGSAPAQFHVYLVGGGQMYPSAQGAASVGDRNIEAARSCLQKAGFLIRAEHIGKDFYRKVELDLESGVVTVIFGNRRINLSGV